MKNLKLKIARYELMKKHQNLVAKGNYQVAEELLHFLRYGRIYMGFDDISWECESILEKLGFKIFVNGRTGRAYCSVNWKNWEN